MNLKSIKKLIKEIDASNMKPSAPAGGQPPDGGNRRKDARITDTQFPDLEQTLEDSTKNNPYLVLLPTSTFMFYKEGNKFQMVNITTKIPPPDLSFDSVDKVMQRIEQLMINERQPNQPSGTPQSRVSDKIK